MTGEYVGKCYYCKEDIFHNRPRDYGAFTKRWDKKTRRYVCSDYFHTKCYIAFMNSAINAMRGETPKEEYKQLSLFD